MGWGTKAAVIYCIEFKKSQKIVDLVIKILDSFDEDSQSCDDFFWEYNKKENKSVKKDIKKIKDSYYPYSEKGCNFNFVFGDKKVFFFGYLSLKNAKKILGIINEECEWIKAKK